MTDRTGGPAFPTRNTLNDGMTLRDYFAAKAMQALVSATTKMEFTDGQFMVDVMDETRMTKMAYIHADSMLKAREQ